MSRQTAMRDAATRNSTHNARPQSKDGEEKGMWSSLLDSVASGKKLPEKNLIVLGGTPDLQKEFFDVLASDTPRRPQDRHRRRPVIANDFALGYTYQDVLDADQEDILARLSIYLLSEPSPSFAPLLKPLFTAPSIPESLLVLLLDWSEPWRWVRQIRDWVVLLQNVTSTLSEDTKDKMQEIMKEWQEHRRGFTASDTGGSNTEGNGNVTIPLSQGEWDESLGLPLCVICHGADKVDALEVDNNWKEDEFDYVLQFLRTILMKHGASLIYTSNSTPNSLPNLIHSTLGIHSPLKKQSLKHNIIDRDKILVPPNWDSWGKIRVLREGFDVESVSDGWSIDIHTVPLSAVNGSSEATGNDSTATALHSPASSPEGAVLPSYESTIRDPRIKSSPESDLPPRIEVSVKPTQEFLAQQVETLTRLQAEDEKTAQKVPSASTTTSSNAINQPHDERVNEHIGPVQVNMGGIQVDADDVMKKLKIREKDHVSKAPQLDSITPATTQTPEEQKAENEKLSSFFANLAKRGASGSPRSASGKIAGGKDTPSKKREQT